MVVMQSLKLFVTVMMCGVMMCGLMMMLFLRQVMRVWLRSQLRCRNVCGPVLLCTLLLYFIHSLHIDNELSWGKLTLAMGLVLDGVGMVGWAVL